MSHLSSIFTKVPVDIPNRSGFDMSHENLLTMKVGTLTPVLTEELLPGDSFSCGCLSQITLPPMATDFYGRIDLRLEAFFVPFRILWGGWEGFWTTPISNPFQSSSAGFVNRDYAVPHAFVAYTSSTYSSMNELFGAGSLSDYLGAKFEFSSPSSTTYYVVPNILPFVAYHKIYDDWYRRSDVQKPLFGRPSSSSSSNISGLPYVTAYNASASEGSWSASESISYLLSGNAESASYLLNFPDGVSLFHLRQRNWTKDYFQTAHLYPQSNDSASGIAVDTGSDITIPDIRTANVVQRYIERLNICGLRYSDQIKGVFGVEPSDAILDRAVFLGSSKFGIYNKSVYSTSNGSGSNTQGNPWAGYLAGCGAASKGMGDCSLIDNFTAKEHGYIMVLASIVPHQYYSTGSRRYLARFMPADFANPLLQGLGEQPICKWELNNDPTDYFTSSSASLPDDTQADPNSLAGLIGSGSWLTGGQTTDYFGYAQQYAEYKYHDDEVHGLLREGENLCAFALQTAYDDAELSSDFLQIPTDYLDTVTAVSSALSNYGAWADFYFNAKKVSTLSEYVIPTLGDLKDTHKEKVNYNGTML